MGVEDVEFSINLPRDKTVCTKISNNEQYLLNLLIEACDSSRSAIIRAAIIELAYNLINNLDSTKTDSEIYVIIKSSIDEAREVLRKCRAEAVLARI